MTMKALGGWCLSIAVTRSVIFCVLDIHCLKLREMKLIG